MNRHPRVKDNKHLDFIRGLPCVICGNNIETEAAHVRMADGSIAKPITGITTKPDDCFTVPLCGKCHRDQHECSESMWWAVRGKDPVKIALALYAVSGDHERGEQIVRR